MVSFKVVFGFKNGTCTQKVVEEPYSRFLIGKRIGDEIDGANIGFPGYRFLITGGSDYAGFPMRADIPSTGRKRILTVVGVGVKKKAKGMYQKKTVCGNTIYDRISQINMKVLVEGEKPLIEKTEAKKEETKEETTKSEPKEAKSKEKSKNKKKVEKKL